MNYKERPCIVIYNGNRIPAIFHALSPCPSDCNLDVKKGETVAFVELVNGKTAYVPFSSVTFINTKEHIKEYDISCINSFIESQEDFKTQIKTSLSNVYKNVEFKVFVNDCYFNTEDYEIFLVFSNVSFDKTYHIELFKEWIKTHGIKGDNYICVTDPQIYDKISSLWDIRLLYKKFITAYGV